MISLSGSESVQYFYNILSMEQSMTLLLYWWCLWCRSFPVIFCGLFEWKRISAIYLQNFKYGTVNDSAIVLMMFMMSFISCYILWSVWVWKWISAGFIIVSLYIYCRWISSHKEVESLDQINLCLGRLVLYKDINFHQHMPKSFYDQCFVVRGSF